MKTNSELKHEVKKKNSPGQSAKKLVREVKDSLKDYKNGKYFKGTADEVIRNLRDEANKIKKV